ncbi:MAG: GNAT family N-acetyltransferase [Thermomicrobiales bacterium]
MAANTQLFMRRPGLSDLPSLPELPEVYQVRIAEQADAGALAAVLASAFVPEWTLEHVHAKLLDSPDVVRTWMIWAGDEPAATASARLLPDAYPSSGYLHWVGTHRDHQGKRRGAVVTLAVLHDFRQMGCRDAVLETDPPRLPAIRTYLHLGFRPEYRAAGEDLVWADILARIESYHADGGKMPPANDRPVTRGRTG